MSIHPEMAWMVARAKNEETQSRTALVPAIRAAWLERRSEPAPTDNCVPAFMHEARTKATRRRGIARRASAR
jgi:hypothetical protein